MCCVCAELLRRKTLTGAPGGRERRRVQKKKLWEAVQPELNTSDACVVQYQDKAMLTSAGPVTVASLIKATVG